MLSKPLSIPVNALLRGTEMEVSLEKTIYLRDTLINQTNTSAAASEQVTFAENLGSVSIEELEVINRHYGAQGLFRLIVLARTQTPSDFNHFYGLTRDNLIFLDMLKQPAMLSLLEDQPPLEFDNDHLHTREELDLFNHNVIRPSLSRQLYNPGSRPGYVVYGVGGPRILVLCNFSFWFSLSHSGGSTSLALA